MSKVVTVRRRVWVPVASMAVLLLAAAATINFVPAGTSRVDRARADALLSPKGDFDEPKVGQNAEAAIGANEQRNPDATPDVQAYRLRAYPAKDIPTDASFAAQTGWAALNAGSHSGGSWRLIGPSRSVQPGVLNGLGDGAQVVTAGRVTAMAIGPSCTNRNCTIYVAAAGGGVWRTRNGLAGNPDWQFLSGSFGTNALGSLLIDPNDTSGNTIYAGTGEPNASADSEAGVGIYKSTNGGQDWALVPGSDIFFQRSIGEMALDNNGNLLVPVASGVRGISSADGAISSGSTDHPLVTRGLYRQNGSAFSLIWPAPPPTRGSTRVEVDPSHPGIIYVNAFQQGIWRSLDNGASFSQIFTPQDATVVASAIDRSEFDITTLPGGATRMYVGEGQGGSAGHHSNFFRSDNADTAATFVSLGGIQVDDYCDGQCWYDNVVFTPANHPDVVYLLGSFNYPLFGFNNGRAVLLSTDGGATWSDLTQDSKPTHANATHPDQHAIVVNPNNPYQYWEGSDGGVVRSDGSFADVSYKCDSRGLTGAANSYCKSLLWRVPNSLTSLNNGFSTLQFQSLSVSRQNPQNNLQGGTQDNGTWQYTGSSVVWTQEIYGDGGQSGFASTNDRLRFNTFTGQANDVNFRNGDPTKWVIASGPIITSPEASYFYPPVVADPSPANAATIFQGSFSIWRTQDWAGSQAFLEANCPEFTTAAATATCGDFVVIGPPGQTDLVDSGTYGPNPVYGTDRIGGAVSVIQRSTNPRDTGTLWAATGAGRIFISKNANDAANLVQFTRIDNTSAVSPSRYPSGIYVDSRNRNHAWVSYSGYNVNTPATPGHVFEVNWNGAVATFTDISSNLPDFPITSIVRDDATGDLYASSDFGVMRLARGSATWTVAGSGLPMVEVPNLQIVPGARLLYAATHGRSAWVLRLPED
jgi:hypothetical protein